MPWVTVTSIRDQCMHNTGRLLRCSCGEHSFFLPLWRAAISTISCAALFSSAVTSAAGCQQLWRALPQSVERQGCGFVGANTRVCGPDAHELLH